MKEYIDLKRRVVYKGDVFDALLGLDWAIQEGVEFCDKLPAADVVERKRGEWIWDSRFSDYTCSECHNWDLKTPNFCSNCGADMRGEKNA